MSDNPGNNPGNKTFNKKPMLAGKEKQKWVCRNPLCPHYDQDECVRDKEPKNKNSKCQKANGIYYSAWVKS